MARYDIDRSFSSAPLSRSDCACRKSSRLAIPFERSLVVAGLAVAVGQTEQVGGAAASSRSASRRGPPRGTPEPLRGCLRATRWLRAPSGCGPGSRARPSGRPSGEPGWSAGWPWLRSYFRGDSAPPTPSTRPMRRRLRGARHGTVRPIQSRTRSRLRPDPCGPILRTGRATAPRVRLNCGGLQKAAIGGDRLVPPTAGESRSASTLAHAAGSSLIS